MNTSNKSKVSRKVKDMFHEAIERAVNPGECRYANNGKPQCVIGQFAALYNPKEFKRLAAYERNRAGAGTVGTVAERYDVMPWGTTVLGQDLQSAWDVGITGVDGESETRLYMHLLVEAFE